VAAPRDSFWPQAGARQGREGAARDIRVEPGGVAHAPPDSVRIMFHGAPGIAGEVGRWEPCPGVGTGAGTSAGAAR
jgi:hypothetical protein